MQKPFTKSVLIADDDAGIREVIREQLEMAFPEERIMFCEAADGTEALSRLSYQKFDTLILDIKMPKKDGIQVISDLFRLKDNYQKPQHTILMSGFLPPEIAKMQSIQVTVVNKPFEFHDLCGKIKAKWQGLKTQAAA